MAVYKWRIPMLAAVQFDGKNHKAVKELIGDDSEEKEKFMLHTGKFEEPKASASPQPEGEVTEGQPEGTEGTQSGSGEIQGDQQQVPGGTTGDTSSRGTTGDAEAEKEPPEPPKEILEPLSVSEGDWVTKDVANGKVEVNPEGFPEKYEFISA